VICVYCGYDIKEHMHHSCEGTERVQRDADRVIAENRKVIMYECRSCLHKFTREQVNTHICANSPGKTTKFNPIVYGMYEQEANHDPVNHPSHYTSHPSKVECIEITRHMGFNLGNAMKYIWRADLKNGAIEDLKKAQWYIQDELTRRDHE